MQTRKTTPGKLTVILLLTGWLLAACRGAPAAPPTSPAAAAGPTAVALTAAPTIPQAATPGAPLPTPALAGTASPAQAPQVLPYAWDDRSIFKAGLIASEQGALDGLPGASLYHIDLTIGADRASLQGEQEVRYTNRTGVALDRLYFRLFPNLMNGAMQISQALVDGAPVQPGLEQQDSALGLPLSPPLAPGGQVVVRLSFTARVPQGSDGGYNTFVYAGEILSLAQFYPLIPAYDAAGWHLEIPPRYGDPTYTETSFYVVRVHTPAGLVIAASGRLLEQSKTGETQVVTYAGGPMRDFYLSGSARYQIVQAAVGETTVSSYAFPEYQAEAALTLDYAKAAFDSFGKRFGPYPYTTFNIVQSPTAALGVEYPGEIALAQPLYDPQASPGQLPGHLLLEGTTAHEVAHQWFYGVVGDDQVNQPWLDESMAQYDTYLYFEDRPNPAAAQGYRQNWSDRLNRATNPNQPVGLPVSAYDERSYSGIVYGRGPIFLQALSEQMGQDKFAAFLKNYYRKYEWGIATTAGFEALAQQDCGCDLSGLFSEWVGGQ